MSFLPVVEKDGAEQLVDDVTAFFLAHNVRAAVVEGWRERQKQNNQGPGGAARVVFTPGDEDGSCGELSLEHLRAGEVSIYDQSMPPNVVAKARRLRMWAQTLVVSVWAHDDTKSSDERAQIEAVRQLFSWTVRAVQASPAGAANAQWGKIRWASGEKTQTPTELRNGAELRAWLELRTVILDTPVGIAYPAPALTTDPVKR